MQFEINTNEDSYNLHACIKFIGDDLLVSIYGGEKPHIGAVSMGFPRPSNDNPELISSTASVFCFSGHKEDNIARDTAELLARTINSNVVVPAGMHWDEIDKDGIKKVIENSRILVNMIIEKIKKIRKPPEI